MRRSLLALLATGQQLFSSDADADFNGDGSVNFLDLALMKAGFFGARGPGASVP